MTIGVKICGVSTEAAIEASVEAAVDWVGFVFFAASPRHVTPSRAASLIARLPPSIAPVGLFVSATDDEIGATLHEVPLSALQVYDRPSRIAGLRDRFGVPVWHACPVLNREDLPRVTEADRLLIEARAASPAARPGGHGTALDWSIIPGWHAPAPWMLAGGLTPDNVAMAIRTSGARSVDVSSGVESSPGMKDARAILAFTHAARRAAERDQ